MNRTSRCLTALSIFLSLAVPAFAAGDHPITVALNGQVIIAAKGAFMENDVPWVPANAAAKALGLTLSASADSYKVRGSEATFPRRTTGGVDYAPLALMVDAAGHSIAWSGVKADIVARIDDVRFSEGKIKIAASMPVRFQVNRLTDPERVYIDLSPARLAGPGGETTSDTSVVRSLRVAQYEPQIVRVVAQTANRVGYSPETASPARNVEVAIGANITIPPASGGSRVAAISSVTLEEGDVACRLHIRGDRTLAPQQGVDIQKDQLWLEFSPAVTPEEIKRIAASGKYIRSAWVERKPGGVPSLRLVVEASRTLTSRVLSGGQPNEIIWDLRPPAGSDGNWNEKVIIIDPGHGGSESGASANGLREKDANLGISRYVTEELRRQGLKVVMTREGDQKLTLRSRTDAIGRHRATLFVSIHNNSNGRPNSATGTEVYYHMQDADSRALAEVIHKRIVNDTGMKARGARSDSRLYKTGLFVLRNSTVPAALVEVGYVNHSGDATRLKNPEFQKKVARAIADGIVSYLGGPPKGS